MARDDVQPIETRYKGYRFRSRLEARWAVFFDHLPGVQWDYEPEGFELPGGLRYLPDFHVSHMGWVEIKPAAHLITPYEWVKMDAFAAAAAKGRIPRGDPKGIALLWLLCGPPAEKVYDAYACARNDYGQKIEGIRRPILDGDFAHTLWSKNDGVWVYDPFQPTLALTKAVHAARGAVFE